MSTSPAVIDHESFREPPSRLFREYVKGGAAAAPFYEAGGRWDLEAIAGRAGPACAFPRPRREVAEALVRQQLARGGEAAAGAARRLAEPGAVAIVTGQQPGLFGGPLLVLHKALAVLDLARRLERATGRPAVPVFWVASDDHDFAEIRSLAVLDAGGGIREIRYAPAEEPGGRPAADVVLDDSLPPLLQELEACLPATPHRARLGERLARAYRPGATMAGAFAELLSGLLGELVVLDASDPALRRLAAPVLRRELGEGSPSSRLAREAGARLVAAGFHQQVPVRDGFLNLFLVSGGERRALALDGNGLQVRGTERRLALDEALAALERDPSPWSPGVLLRPLAQDFLLPTVAYVGGPAEVAYHAQLGPAYAWLGIPRPVVVPRPSLTLVEPAQARVLETEGLALPDLQQDPEAVLSRWAREAHPEVEGAFARAREAVAAELRSLETLLGDLDPTLAAAARAAAGRSLHPLDGLREKAVRALKRRDQARAERLRRTRDALLPGGSLQERGLGWAGLLARRGEGVLDLLREAVDPWARGHQVVAL